MRIFLDERLIVREAGSGTRNILESYLKRHNLVVADFAHVTEMNNVTAIKELVKQGAGITFLYGFAVQEELKQKVRSRPYLLPISPSPTTSPSCGAGAVFSAPIMSSCSRRWVEKPHK